MSIRDIKSSTSRPDLPLNGSAATSRSSENRAASAAAPQRAETLRPDGDRVELSGQAPVRDAQATEIDFAKKALLGYPPLDPTRATDILRRVQEGYYSQPEILKMVSERVVQDFSGQAPDADTALGLPPETPKA